MTIKKKYLTIKVVAALLLLVLIFPTVSFADSTDATDCDTKYIESSNEILSVLAGQYKYMSSPNIKVEKLNDSEKTDVLEGSDQVKIRDSEVYYLTQSFADNDLETIIIADASLVASGGTVEETKEGRVVITCVLRYERFPYKGIDYVRGVYFGGKVNSQQSGLSVTSIKATYTDCGAYVTNSGSTGIAGNYTNNKTISVSDRYSLKTFSLSRDKYFNTTMPATNVVAKYSVTYTMGGKSSSIYVNAYAYS